MEMSTMTQNQRDELMGKEMSKPLSIKTTIGVLVGAEQALQNICALRLGATSAYHLKKLARLVVEETRHFYSERDALLKEFGTKNGNGWELKSDSERWPEFAERMKDLVAVEVEIAWRPIDLAMLGDEKVSAADLEALGPLLSEPV